MKLIFCPKCSEIVPLEAWTEGCPMPCGKSWGRYLDDGLNAVYGGSAIPLEIDDASLADAVQSQRPTGKGVAFRAFVISKDCETFRREQPEK